VTRLWEVAVAVYEAPGVRELVLDLQDRHGCDVPLLLALAWLDARGVAIDDARYAALAEASAAWQREVVTPLRAARRALRPRAEAPTRLSLADAARDEFKRRVQALELAAEKHQLERLEAMRTAAARLMARDRLGRDVFARGAPEAMGERRTTHFTASLLDLIQAYARLRTKDDFRPFSLDRGPVLPLEEALERLRPLIGFAGDWTDLASYLPADWRGDPGRRRSALASTFAASLELVKEGAVELRQEDNFAPISLRRRATDR
jgi:uncharacterized protein (TIGR02444 family)